MLGVHGYLAIAAGVHPVFDANYWIVIATAAPVIALAGIVSLADTNRRYSRFSEFLSENFTIEDSGSSEPTKQTPITSDVYERFGAARAATYCSLIITIFTFLTALISLQESRSAIAMPPITGAMLLSLVALAAAPLIMQSAARNEGAARREYVAWRIANRESSASDEG